MTALADTRERSSMDLPIALMDRMRRHKQQTGEQLRDLVERAVTAVLDGEYLPPLRPAAPPEVYPPRSIRGWKPLTDAQWARIEPVILAGDPLPAQLGRVRADPRRCLDAITYELIEQCPWNRLPTYFPDDSTVHRVFLRWRGSGLLGRVMSAMVGATQ